MRDIKFRVWDTEENKFKETGFMINQYGSLMQYGEFEKMKKISRDRYKILQYTGLKDKEGKEIYEGDISKTEFCLKGLVFYDDGGFKLTSERGGILNKKIFDELNNDLIKLNELKVIGNKYENPKLLGGE